MAEWLKAADCKSALERVRGFKSLPAHHAGVAQLARALAFQAEGRGFESRLPLQLFIPFAFSSNSFCIENFKLMKNQRIVFGIHSVRELIKLRPDAIEEMHVLLSHRQLDYYRKRAKRYRIPLFEHVKPKELDKLIGKAVNHQGILLLAAPFRYLKFEDILDSCHRKVQHSCILLLDGITDPQNLGAIIRSAGFYGINGILLPKDRSSVVNETVLKIASGAVEHVPIAQVTNAVRSLKDLKKQGFWSVGLGERAKKPLYEIDFNMDIVLVIGSEGKGVRRLVRENCDFWVNLPNHGKIPSLNAASATTIALYEISRQRELSRKQY